MRGETGLVVLCSFVLNFLTHWPVFSSVSEPSRAKPSESFHFPAGPPGQVSIAEWNVRAPSADDVARTNH